MSYRCGEKPGKGRYVCLNCGEDLYLDDNTDTRESDNIDSQPLI